MNKKDAIAKLVNKFSNWDSCIFSSKYMKKDGFIYNIVGKKETLIVNNFTISKLDFLKGKSCLAIKEIINNIKEYLIHVFKGFVIFIALMAILIPISYILGCILNWSLFHFFNQPDNNQNYPTVYRIVLGFIMLASICIFFNYLNMISKSISKFN